MSGGRPRPSRLEHHGSDRTFWSARGARRFLSRNPPRGGVLASKSQRVQGLDILRNGPDLGSAESGTGNPHAKTDRLVQIPGFDKVVAADAGTRRLHAR